MGRVLQLASEWLGTECLLSLNIMQQSMKRYVLPRHMQCRLCEITNIGKIFYRIYDYIPAAMLAGLIKGKDSNSTSQLSITVVATSDRTIDLIWKTPTV